MWSECGGGLEIVVAVLVTFCWYPRSKSIYYFTLLGLFMVFESAFKLVHAAPRPYMIDCNIKAGECAREFGLPSGHSSASALFAITVFLDAFHGVEIERPTA